MKRNRWIYFAAGCVVTLLGLASRKLGEHLPGFLAEYAGDTLWALLVFLLFGWLWPQASTFRIGMMTLLFAFAVEISQTYHAPWIDRLRGTTLGGLVLGFGFLWSDLVCYTAGMLIGMLGEWSFTRSREAADPAS